LTDKDSVLSANANDESLISTSFAAITDLVSGSSIPDPIKKMRLKHSLSSVQPLLIYLFHVLKESQQKIGLQAKLV
jgi:hypothetical protein